MCINVQESVLQEELSEGRGTEQTALLPFTAQIIYHTLKYLPGHIISTQKGN